MDDVLEIVHKGEVNNLTERLNKVYYSNILNSIKFTYEEKQDGAIPFLDTFITKNLMEWKSYAFTGKRLTPINTSNFPHTTLFIKKLDVIRTLLDRSESIVTEVIDREKEEFHICPALAACGYLEWTANNVKQQRSQPKSKPPTKNKLDSEKSKGLAVLPYVQCYQSVWREFSKKSRLLQDVKTSQNSAQFVTSSFRMNSIPNRMRRPLTKSPVSYIGETGRPFGVKL